MNSFRNDNNSVILSKAKISRIFAINALLLMLLAITSCDEKLYTINEDFYNDKTVSLKNEMKGDTLFIEQDNKTDILMLEEPNNPDISFDNRGFIFTVHDESIVSIDQEGAIVPLSRGVTQVDIVSRTAKNLRTSIYLKVYKQYVAVESIIVPSEVLQVEVDVPRDLKKDVFVFPTSADNGTIHFSLDEASKQYATITDDGIITGTMAPASSKTRIIVNVVSDEFDSIKNTFKLSVLNEIPITGVELIAGLDGAEISVGEVIDLSPCASVTPENIKEENKKVTFELIEGTDVLELSSEGVIKAIGTGTARLVAKAKEQIFNDKPQQKSVEFTIVVKEGVTDLTRLLWTVKTSVSEPEFGGYGYVPDNTTGMPQDMFDGNTTTFLSITKPGKTYSDCTTPADHNPYFVVDMKSTQKFNYMRWNHRSNQTNINLRVWKVDLEGSADGETWREIGKDIVIIDKDKTTEELPYGKNSVTYHIPLPAASCRYVKVTYTDWSDLNGIDNGSTLQVAEFGLGYDPMLE